MASVLSIVGDAPVVEIFCAKAQYFDRLASETSSPDEMETTARQRATLSVLDGVATNRARGLA